MTSTEHPDVIALALAIADEEARCQIECNCRAEARDDRGVVWWDTSADDGPGDDDAAEFEVVITTPTCVRYLELRDLIVHHPTRPHLVRFVDHVRLKESA